jgi:hypothetical protein
MYCYHISTLKNKSPPFDPLGVISALTVEVVGRACEKLDLLPNWRISFIEGPGRFLPPRFPLEGFSLNLAMPVFTALWEPLELGGTGHSIE